MNRPSTSTINWARQTLGHDADSAGVTALAAEASFRQFYRISAADGSGSTRSWILMDSPPDKERNEQFCHLAAVFGAAGLPVPEVIAQNPEAGWFLMTDLGDRDLEMAYQQGQTQAAIDAAIAVLVELQQLSDPALEPYTAQRFTDELEIFSEWFLTGLLNITLPQSLQSSFATLVARMGQQPQCCVHRDYHCRNLLFSPEGRFGIVDFQDALIGPAAYDLASLLYDCYHEFPEALIASGCARYLALRSATDGSDYDPEQFRQDLDFCAIQRQLKAIGIFARLARRDGKSSHLRYISPVLARLARLCSTYPILAELGQFLTDLQPQESAWQN